MKINKTHVEIWAGRVLIYFISPLFAIVWLFLEQPNGYWVDFPEFDAMWPYIKILLFVLIMIATARAQIDDIKKRQQKSKD